MMHFDSHNKTCDIYLYIDNNNKKNK